MSRTKIIATIGPKSNNRAMLAALHKAGMSMARLNGSHNTLEWHAEVIGLLRETAPFVPILFDIPGSKVRLGRLAHEPSFKAGDEIIFTSDANCQGTEKILVNYAGLHEDLYPGAVFLVDDGSLRFTVLGVDGQNIVCRAETAGTIRSGKGVNAPLIRLRAETLSKRDGKMINFASDCGIDYIGVSFVESPVLIEAIRALCPKGWPRIVAKIENQGGLDNLERIIDAADAVMIDRGDLSVETNLEQLALYQKRILAAAQKRAKPAIVATEMLHSMIENAAPTKAEVCDITNAVLDGATAAMLSGETAVGAHAVAAVAVMRRILTAAEDHLQRELDGGNAGSQCDVPEAVGAAAALLCRSLPVTKIVAVTLSGFAARAIASRNPRQPILAVSNDERAARSFNLIPGAKGVHVDVRFSRTNNDHIAKCLETLWRNGDLAAKDMVLVASLSYPRSGNRMNLLETHVVGDLIETLGWR